MSMNFFFKQLALLCFGILMFQISFSQENYFSGYVITNEGDTLSGFIDYPNRAENPNQISFKERKNDSPVLFNPTDIVGFGTGNEKYVSGIIKTEVTNLDADKLEYDPQIHLKIDTTFLQTIIGGKKSLYYYKNTDGRVNFYIKQGSEFELLLYKRYLKQQEGKSIITENKTYLGQLTLYLNDCLSIQSKIEVTSYKTGSLIALFRYYYDCSSIDIPFQKRNEKITTATGVLMGSSLGSLKFSGNVIDYLANADYNYSVNFAAGMFFDLIFPKNKNRWSISNELLFSAYKVSGSYEQHENENSYSTTTTELGYSYLKINNLVRFKYPIGNAFLFVNGGISNGLAVSETNYKKVELRYYTVDKINEGIVFDETRKYEQGYIFGAGAKIKKFSFEFRYEKGNGMSKYATISSSTRKYFCLFGYTF